MKLFKSLVTSGKVERGLDIARRLHTERSFDVVIQMADRTGHRKLSDRIEDLKNQRHPPIDEEEEDFNDSASYDSGRRSERSNSFDGYDEPVVTTRQQRMEMMSQREISPDGEKAVYTPQQRRSHNDEESEGGYNSTDEESPPRESLKRKFEDDKQTVAKSKKRINPFAKKNLQSPAKGIMKVKSPAKPVLSRASTFSAKSRQKQRTGKQIM